MGEKRKGGGKKKRERKKEFDSIRTGIGPNVLHHIFHYREADWRSGCALNCNSDNITASYRSLLEAERKSPPIFVQIVSNESSKFYVSYVYRTLNSHKNPARFQIRGKNVFFLDVERSIFFRFPKNCFHSYISFNCHDVRNEYRVVKLLLENSILFNIKKSCSKISLKMWNTFR